MRVAEIFHTMSYGPAPESASAAQAWLADHGRELSLFINNTWHAAKDSRTFESRNPATGELLAKVADGGREGVDQAVAAARAAFEPWRALSGHARARHLYAVARHIQKHARLLAVMESLDNGKPIRETRDIDVPLVARHFYYHAGWAQLAETELSGYQPVGVIGQVIPWNFPLLMLAWKIAPAIALGNTVVLKPAPFTSITALLLAEILAEAGLPPGVVNIVPGSDETGKALVDHPGVDKIAFTGSTEVGRILRRATAGTGKRLSLELGGKSPFIVFDDADQDSAVEGLVDAIWFNQGQVCCAGSRLLVQESIAPGFLDKVRRRMATLRVGDPLDKGIDIGAIVDPIQRDQIDRWVQRGVAEGATLFQPDCPLPDKGCWYRPTLLTHVATASTVWQEEIFGPVVVAMTFRTPNEAVALANNTRYGLAASIWSENISLALDTARRVKAGTVWINSTNLFDAAAGFGGYRESGFGREGGREGLFEYLRPAHEERPRPALAKANGKWGEAALGRPAPLAAASAEKGVLPALDRTPKLFIKGKQARPDSGYTRGVYGPDGALVGQVAEGSRKDIREAVEAAQAASGWGYRNGHARAQILYYLAENLSARGDEFAARITAQTGRTDARAEVDAAIDRLFTCAAWADKYGGTVQETPLRGITLALHEPVGVIGVVCPDDAPLLALITLVGAALARGNTVIVVPGEAAPLTATDFYQVVETSDVPPGVLNIVTGARDALAKTLAEHDDVDAVWYFGTAEGSAHVEALSAENMKRTWVGYGLPRDWRDGGMEEALREATQVKNVWTPSGE